MFNEAKWVTVMSLIIWTIQLFEHPTVPFQEKGLIIVFQAFEHPRLKPISINTYTWQSSNGGRQMSTSLWQSLRSCSEGYWMSSSILQVFSTSTRLLQSFPNIYISVRRYYSRQHQVTVHINMELEHSKECPPPFCQTCKVLCPWTLLHEITV